MRVTLDKIAAELGVSRSTVSRALRDSPQISQSTKDKVKTLAAEMGYIPNDLARSLRTNRTGVLGLITYHSDSVGVLPRRYSQGNTAFDTWARLLLAFRMQRKGACQGTQAD